MQPWNWVTGNHPSIADMKTSLGCNEAYMFQREKIPGKECVETRQRGW